MVHAISKAVQQYEHDLFIQLDAGRVFAEERLC